MTDVTSPSARVALVLGASRGLGAALAEALGASGWQVVAVARTAGALEELDDRIRAAGGLPAMLAPMDVTNVDAMRHLCRSLHDRWGRVDLWVHAAIQAPPLGPAGHIAEKDWSRALDTNLRAPGLLVGMIEPLLRAAPDGKALFFDDPAARTKFHGAYGATKAGQMALVRSWQLETARIGPTVIIDTPAPMPTGLRARFHPGEPRERLTPCRDEAARILALLN